MEIISAENLHFTYPGDDEEALHGLNFEISKGQFVAILGRNGSGKSTLAKMFNGILLPSEGKVTVCGMDTSAEENILPIRRQVGMVFQNPDNQIVAGVVEDDVAFAPENLGVPPEEIRERVDRALKLVNMYEYREHAPHLLSGGQKQRVAIAGVLAMEPDVIVLDEPTAMLDPQGRQEVVGTVTRLCREQGITVILITHHMAECVDADRLMIMDEGRITADGSPAEVFSRVELLKKEGLTVPASTYVVHKLNAAGFSLPLSALTPEACAQAIAGALLPCGGEK
jgi:energy-coupling factor transport system ATP-binding protein